MADPTSLAAGLRSKRGGVAMQLRAS